MKKFILLLALVFSSLCFNAQSFTLTPNHLSIKVKDKDISGEFYRNILQLREVPTPWGDHTPLPAVFFDLGNNQELHITQYAEPIKLHKFIHFAFSVADFDGYLEFLDKKGIEYGDFSGKNKKFQIRIDGVKQIYFQDPDGYWIEVNDART